MAKPLPAPTQFTSQSKSALCQLSFQQPTKIVGPLICCHKLLYNVVTILTEIVNHRCWLKPDWSGALLIGSSHPGLHFAMAALTRHSQVATSR